MRPLIVLLLVLGLGCPAVAGAAGSVLGRPAAFADPPTDTRPKFRWWWGNFLLPSTVDQAAIPEELRAMADAGFGGVEIGFTPSVWANPMQRDALKTALTTAKGLGLRVDMTLGANWPMTTPNTKPGSGLSEQELMYGRTDLAGPTAFDGAPAPAIGDDQPRGKLVALTGARVISGNVLDPASLVDLTSRLRADGTLHWDVPEGDWILFSYWQRDTEEGVVDHLRAASVTAALQYIDNEQLGGATDQLPGSGGDFFEDSLELDADQLLWTDDLPAEFKRRRGYDMTKYLPLMFVPGENTYWVPDDEPAADFELPGGNGFRYRHDYFQTLTDLYIANHLRVIARWAGLHGMRFRAQPAFGNALDVVRSARALARAGGLVDDESLNAGDLAPLRPDATDWRFAFDHYRTITSGSQQGGSNQIGFELGAKFYTNLTAGLTDYAQIMNKALAAGITRPLIHGYQSQQAGAPWPGDDHFIGVVTDSWNHRTFPQWAMWKPLTDYWARAAEVLEPGRPQTDVAIYRDGFITTAARITDLLGEMVAPVAHPRPHPLFDGEPLERAGYTLGYVDPVGVRQGQVRGAGTLFPRRSAYRALVVDERSLPARTAVALDRASAAGLQVVFVGTLPSRSPSGRAPAAEDRTVRRAVRRIRGRATTRVVAHQSDAAGALAAMGLQPAARWSTPAPLYTQRRTVGRDAVYYVWNAGDDTVRTTASFLAAGLPRQLDLWNGTITELAEYRQTGGRMAVPLTLGPGEATVFAFRGAPQHFAHVTRTTAQSATLDGNRIALTGAGGKRVSVRFSNGDTRRVTLPAAPAAMPLTDWKLQVQAALPTGTLGLTGTGLGDWRDQPALATASGVGTYTAKVTLPADFAGGATLDLGKIDGAAQVYLNDTLITRELSPDHPVDVGNALRGGDNTIRVVLSTTLRNAALAVLPVTTLSRPTFATNSTTQAYGLIGPVTLAPYARADIRRPHV